MLFKALHGSSQRLDRPGIVFPTKDAPEFPVHESARSKARHHERPECKGPGTRVKCFQINFCQQRPRHRKTLGKLSRCRAACAIRSTSGSHLDPYRLNKAFEWNAMLLFWFNDRWGVSCHKKHKRTQKCNGETSTSYVILESLRQDWRSRRITYPVRRWSPGFSRPL